MAAWFAVLMEQLDFSLDSTGLVAIALVLFLEELGVPSPIPGDLMMLLAGVLVAERRASLWSVLLVQEAVTLVGATLLYWISRRAGRPLVLRYGRYVALGPERLERLEEQIRGREVAAIFLGRLVPGLRILTVVAAGVANVAFSKFVLPMAVSSFIYLTIYTLIGMWVGPPILRMVSGFSAPASMIWSVAGLVTVALTIRALRRSASVTRSIPPPLATLTGGLLAGLTGLLGANVAVGILKLVARLSGDTVRLGITQPLEELHFILAWPVFLLAAVGCGLLHRQFRLRQVVPTLRLLVTTILPAGLTLLLLVEPLRDMAGPEARETSRTLVASTAIVRWAIFGFVVELLPLHVPAREHSSRPA